MTDTTFSGFGFAEPIARALAQRDYTTPTAIQVQGLPPQLQGRDLMALAETGSGKTAAFLLPILDRFAKEPADIAWKQVGALILAPTRELALQIDAEIASLARNMHIRRAVVLGGVGKGPQIAALKRGVHILVATPGRLLDLVNMRCCELSGVNTLVLDEADRMFDMGFIRDIRKIASLIPHKRRTALFSATMPTEIRALAKELLNDPAYVDLQPKQMVVDRIDQKVMIVRAPEKQSRLHTILKDDACSRVIVFTRTKRGADRVTERLGMAGIGAAAIHGNKAQNARQRALGDFTKGHVRVLVATDIAARGIDVSDISHVINFDMPLEPETYVHRIGRTARKGTSGIAISLCDPSERPEITAIEKLMKQKIEVIDDVGGEVLPMPEKRPHQTHDKPRREGAHRRGPSAHENGEHRGGGEHRGPKKEGHRKGGFRKQGGGEGGSFRKDARPPRDFERAAEPRRGDMRPYDPLAAERPAEETRRPDFKRDRDNDFKRDRDNDRRKEGHQSRGSEHRGPRNPNFSNSRGPENRDHGRDGEQRRGENRHGGNDRSSGPRPEQRQRDAQGGRRDSHGENTHSPFKGHRDRSHRDDRNSYDGANRSHGNARTEPRDSKQRGEPRNETRNEQRKERHGGSGQTWQGQEKWRGQKPPKFLSKGGDRSDSGDAPRRKPNAKPAA